MSDERKRDEEELGFEIEDDSDTQAQNEDTEGLSREQAADLLKNFNSIFDNEDS